MDRISILLADDHAIVRAGICNALSDLPDLEVVGEVGNGPDLEQALRELQPDLLLIDVAMPDFEPINAIRSIREAYPDLKILVVSAYDNDYYVQGLFGAGIDGYHLKDESLRELRSAIKRVLEGQRWVSSSIIDKLVGNQEPSVVQIPLTIRQREILRLLQQGLDNRSIADKLELSIKTVENHLTKIYMRLDVNSRLEAVRYATMHPEVLGIWGQNISSPKPESKPNETRPLRILLVEDNISFRHELRKMIGKLFPNTRIYEADKIGEALNLSEQIAPQLAFVDVVLGDESGIHCTRQIKSMSPVTQVILISAYPDRGFRTTGLEAGATAFVDKRDLDGSTIQQIIGNITS